MAPYATTANPRTTTKMAKSIMGTSASRSCAMALGRKISSRTSTRLSATRTCPLSMLQPACPANGSGTTPPVTRSTPFVDSESKWQTRVQALSCLMLSMPETSRAISTHSRLTHTSKRPRRAINTTRTRSWTMALRRFRLKVMQDLEIPASANMPSSTASRTFPHSSSEATTRTATLATSITTTLRPRKAPGISLLTT